MCYSARYFWLTVATLWASTWRFLVECHWHYFERDVRNSENHYPKNDYPKNLFCSQQQVQALRTYAVDVRDGEVWVDTT